MNERKLFIFGILLGVATQLLPDIISMQDILSGSDNHKKTQVYFMIALILSISAVALFELKGAI